MVARPRPVLAASPPDQVLESADVLFGDPQTSPRGIEEDEQNPEWSPFSAPGPVEHGWCLERRQPVESVVAQHFL